MFPDYLLQPVLCPGYDTVLERLVQLYEMGVKTHHLDHQGPYAFPVPVALL
jgi:hypothetical protein